MKKILLILILLISGKIAYNHYNYGKKMSEINIEADEIHIEYIKSEIGNYSSAYKKQLHNYHMSRLNNLTKKAEILKKERKESIFYLY